MPLPESNALQPPEQFAALFNRRLGDTFSEHVWRWFAVRRKGRFAIIWSLVRVSTRTDVQWARTGRLLPGRTPKRGWPLAVTTMR